MWLGVAALFAVSLGYGVVVPLLPGLLGTRAEGADAAALGVVYAGYAAAKISAQVPGGAWADRAGSSTVLRIALALYVVSLAGFLAPWGVAWFAAMRVVEGAATGLVYPAVFARVMHATGGRASGRQLGAVVGLGTAGLLVGPALGAWLAPQGPRVPIAVALVAGIAVLAAVLFTPTANDRAREPRSTRQELRSLWAMGTTGVFLASVLPIFFNKLTYSALQGLLPVWGAHGLGLDTRGITALFALTGVGFGLAQPVGGWLADRASPRAVVAVTTAPVLAGLGVMSTVREPLAFTLGYAAYVCGTSVVFAATMKHLADRGESGRWGGMYGLMGTLTDTATVLGPPLLLGLYGVHGPAVFADMAVMGALAVLLFLWRGHTHTTSRAPSPTGGDAVR